MKNYKTSISIYLFSILLYTLCSSNLKTLTVQNAEILKSNLEVDNFEFGTWRIDSVCEDDRIKDRLTEDSIIQVFNFRKDGVFSMMEVALNDKLDRVIGKWKVEEDSLFIISEKGLIGMRFGYKIKGSCLILNGNFQISSYNKKKPSFYLSKYIEEFNEKTKSQKN